MHYLLDTNIVSDLIRNPQGRVTERIREVGEAQVCTSIIVAAELRYGAAKRGSLRLTAQVEAVLGALEVLPFAAPAAYGVLRARSNRLVSRSAAMICSLPLRPLPSVTPSLPTTSASSPGSTAFAARIGSDNVRAITGQIHPGSAWR
jgi:predicted nucleic acid-binding protein